MARNSVITAVITADTDKFDRAIGKTQSKLGGFAKGAGMAAVGVAGLAATAYAVGKPLVDAASNFEEAASKVDTVFGDASASVRTFADQAATNFGLSSTQALDAAGRFGVFGENAGLAGDDLSEFSNDLVAAASDLASFNNLETDEALQKLQAGLAGEAEPLRALGIDLSAAAVEARAAELGMEKLNGKLTEQQKTMARSSIILDENNSYMGDFARTSDGLANQQRILQARFSDVQVELGQKLLPVAMKLMEWGLNIVDAIAAVIDVFSEQGLSGVLDMVSEKFAAFETVRVIVGEVFDYITDQVQNIITVFDGLIDFVKAVFTGDWGAAWAAIKQIFTGVWDTMTRYVQAAWALIQAAVGVIIDGVKRLWDWSFLSDWVNTAINAVVTFFGNLPGRLSGFFGLIGDAIKAPFVSAFNAVKSLWNATVGGFGFTVPSWIPGVGGKGFRIPEMAEGGIVTGPTLAVIGEAGPEAVIPLGSNRAGNYGVGGGGGMVHVVLQVDGRTLAETYANANRDAGGVFV